jgi:hypothetical protein
MHDNDTYLIHSRLRLMHVQTTMFAIFFLLRISCGSRFVLLQVVTHVLASRGSATEELSLISPPDTEGGIDVWLSKVDIQTQATIKLRVQTAIRDGDNYMVQNMVMQYPAQVGILVLHLNWAMETVRALKKASQEANAMITANKRNMNVVAELVGILERHEQFEPHHRFSVQNMIIVQMHLRDVFDEIVKKNVVSDQVIIERSCA